MSTKEDLFCYLRVSSDVQEKQGYSLDVQRDLGLEVSQRLRMKVGYYNQGSRSSTIH